MASSVCPVKAYAEGVVGEKYPACKWVRLACERHLSDLRNGGGRGLVWDGAAAAHALEFFGWLKHSKGRWNSEPFVLSPWQEFIVGSLFGWRLRSGLRRFRQALVEVPRKNGKTTLAAAIALYLFLCDGEAGAEVYSVATKRDQAKLVFEDAKALIAACPEIAEIVERYRYSIQIPDARSKFEPLASDSDTLDGLNPFVAICDEIHAWKSRDLWDVLLTGMGAREQPLALAITTAGDFSESIYNELHNDAEQMLDGVVADDSYFAFIASADVDDDWTDPKCWEKANPNLGVSLKVEELADAIEKAKRRPSSANKTKRLRLNMRTAALNAWLRLDLWDKCGGLVIDPSEYLGRDCYGGLDIANTSDLTSLVWVFPWGDHKGRPVYRIIPRFWCPTDCDTHVAEKLRRRLLPWIDAGFVESTEGNSIDFEAVESVVAEDAKRFNVLGLAYDPFNCEKTAQDLNKSCGIETVRFPQNIGRYNEPSVELERAVADGRLIHGGNPVLRWMASNAITVTNGAGHIMPSRKKSRDKIDGIAALVMGIGCAMTSEKEEASVYEERGFDE
jgi:phage terminase large subunit-like protein